MSLCAAPIDRYWWCDSGHHGYQNKTHSGHSNRATVKRSDRRAFIQTVVRIQRETSVAFVWHRFPFFSPSCFLNTFTMQHICLPAFFFFFTFSFLFKLLLWGTIFFWLDKKKKQKNPTLCKITILSHYAGLSVALLFRNGSRPHVSLLSLFILMYFNSAWCLCYSRHVTTGVVIMRW